MGIYATNSRYDAILLHRQKQRDAAEAREAKSQARREAADKALARSDSLRGALSTSVANKANGIMQLTSQIVSSRVAAENKEKAEATMAKAEALSKLV